MEENKKIKREFGLSSLSVNNRTTVFVLTAIILLSGISSYITMPKESFPELIVPQIYVGTVYPGSAPADIEKLITQPLEKEINTITGIDKLTSTSIQGYSTIIAEFDFDISPTEALRKVKDAVDKARSDNDFPDDLPQEPNIFEMNFSEFPIMNINLSGDFHMDKLKEYGEYLEDKIEDLVEISKVDIRGVQEKEMKINVNLSKMEALKLNFNDLEQAVAQENMTVSGGSILSGNYRRNVRVSGEFESAEDIRNIIVKQEKLDIVYLRDIAEVVFEPAESQSYAREFSKPVVMLDVVKRAGENLIEASEKINKIIEESKTKIFPSDLEISITNDQTEQTKNQLSSLENSIISGVILVVLVLLFFLGLRNALFVGIAIPLSMFMAFMILGAMGVTLNMIVLFSLILALGMLVDNGIVVVENIYRLMDEGMPPIQAAKEGVGEVALPIIASTATTLAAFLPLAFWPGMMGEFMQYLPITLIIVLGSSLFVALVINPVLTAVYMRVGNQKTSKRKPVIVASILTGMGILLLISGSVTTGNLMLIAGLITLVNIFMLSPASQWFQEKLIPKMEHKYETFLKNALKGKRPYLFFAGTIVMLIASFILLIVFTPQVEFFPVNQPNYLNIFIEKPIGTDIVSTNAAASEVESIIQDEISQYEVQNENGELRNYLVNSVIAQVGEGTSDPSQGPVMGNTPHKARVTVSFVEFKFRRGVSTNEVMENIRKRLQGFSGVQITVDKNQDGPPREKPVNIEVVGDDYNLLVETAESLKSFLNARKIGGVEELKLDVEVGKPELLIEIDREKARRFNLSTAQIGMTLRTGIYGKEISTFKKDDEDYPIQLRYSDDYRYDEDLMMNQKITFRDQMTGKFLQVPLSSVAKAVKTSTYSAVKRKNMNRVVTISSNVTEGNNPNEVVMLLKQAVPQFQKPSEVDIRFTGEMEDQAKEMGFLSKALMIAVFLIFLIIVSQFNSASTPFIIVISVVFSLIGVLLGLVFFQMDFVIIMTMIGIISLAGVVVNNAIVLIDYTNLIIERRKHSEGIAEDKIPSMEIIRESIVEGGKKRLRPVLLTAITTVLGLLPLATGLNIDFVGLVQSYSPDFYMGGDNTIFWGPMSWTIIFGLTFATFLTLVIVPVMYLIANRIKYRVYAKRRAIVG